MASEHDRGHEPVVVIESIPPPNERTNPYVVRLVDSMPEGIDCSYLNWWRALFGRYDVFHLHWPEVTLRGRGRLRTALRCVRFLLLLARIRFSSVVLVRTFHNESPHEPLPRIRRWLVGLSESLTSMWIVLSTAGAAPPGSAPVVVIPHAHYRDWFGSPQAADPVRGRVLFFGLVRPYKGVPELMRAVAACEDPEISLRVVGEVTDPDVFETLRSLGAAAADRVTVLDRYVTDDELRAELGAAELVVLPFRRVTNSGSVLLALSMDRPVLVPAVALMRNLAEEVGKEWVRTYEPPLRPEHLSAALAAVRRIDGSPDLSARSWDRIGSMHAEAFRQVTAHRR